MLMYVVFCLLLGGIGQIFAMTAEETRSILKVLHDDCVEESGVDESLIDACNTGDFPEDPKLKCYMMCLITIVPIMNDGEIDVETAIRLLPDEYQEKAAPTLRACGTVKGVDDCDTAFQTNKCWKVTAPENYRLF